MVQEGAVLFRVQQLQQRRSRIALGTRDDRRRVHHFTIHFRVQRRVRYLRQSRLLT